MSRTGNLVTPAWWDDLFLKESFASWLGGLRCSDDLHPERRIRQSFLNRQMFNALTFDASRNTHAILNEKLHTIQELEGTWDQICYAKSPAVVSMIAAYVGEDQFFAGVKTFLRKPHSVATRHDLWEAMSECGKDVVSFAQRWITTEGYPVVLVEKTETGVSLEQKRFLITGDVEEDDEHVTW